MKYIIAILVISLLALMPALKSEKVVRYEIIERQPPTGCPYGDSIPLDSEKCAPPQQITTIDNNVTYEKGVK